MTATIHQLNLQTTSSVELYAAIESFARVLEPIDNRPREGYVLDFKAEWDDKVLKTIAGFANTFGGLVIMGVSESDGRPDKLLGVQLPGELKTRIAGSIATSMYPCPPFEIGECSLAPDTSRKLAVIRVQETSEVCLITKKGISPIYVRNEDQSIPADASQIRTLLQRKATLQNASNRRSFAAYFSGHEFWITRTISHTGTVERSDTELRITAEPTYEALSRLDMTVENQFRSAVFQVFRGLPTQRFQSTVERDRDWFEINLEENNRYQMRWRTTSAGDVAFITQVCASQNKSLWSLYDVVAHMVYAVATVNVFWRKIGYFGSGRVSVALRIPGAELKFDNGYPADYYDEEGTKVPYVLDRELIVPSAKSRWSASASLPTDYSGITESFNQTVAELLHQLLRGLGHGVRYQGCLEAVKLFSEVL